MQISPKWCKWGSKSLYRVQNHCLGFDQQICRFRGSNERYCLISKCEIRFWRPEIQFWVLKWWDLSVSRSYRLDLEILGSRLGWFWFEKVTRLISKMGKLIRVQMNSEMGWNLTDLKKMSGFGAPAKSSGSIFGFRLVFPVRFRFPAGALVRWRARIELEALLSNGANKIKG